MMVGHYDPSKLLKIGISYLVTSSPKIASKSKNSTLYITKPNSTPLAVNAFHWIHSSPCAPLGAGEGHLYPTVPFFEQIFHILLF